jgi:hypothetical protein
VAKVAGGGFRDRPVAVSPTANKAITIQMTIIGSSLVLASDRSDPKYIP